MGVQANRYDDISDHLKRELSQVAVGEPRQYGDLWIFPLRSGELEPDRACELLRTGIDTGVVRVEEVSDAGIVPSLRLRNNGRRPVLVTEGETLVGGKQNRVVNVSLVAEAGSALDIPVSCVEMGRWSHGRSGQFQTGASAPSSLRARKLASLQRERAAGSGPSQRQVWDDVERTLVSTSVSSATSSLHAVYEELEHELSGAEGLLEVADDVRGVVAVASDRILGMELFDEPSALRARWPDLSRGLLLDALRGAEGPSLERPDSLRELVAGFVRQVGGSAAACAPTVGIGAAVSIPGPEIVGTGVWYEGRLRHLAAFANRH